MYYKPFLFKGFTSYLIYLYDKMLRIFITFVSYFLKQPSFKYPEAALVTMTAQIGKNQEYSLEEIQLQLKYITVTSLTSSNEESAYHISGSSVFIPSQL